MKKLYKDYRVGELHRVIQFAHELAKDYNFEDSDFLAVLSEQGDYLQRLVTAIKREELYSDLRKKDYLRNVAYRSFRSLLRGYSELQGDANAKIREAGERCFAVIEKYHTTSHENYYISTTFVDALLGDFASDTAVSDLTLLPGAQLFLDVINESQETFKQAQQAYEQYRSNREESPTSLRRPVQRFFNTVFLPMLNTKVYLDPDTYSEYALTVENFVDEANAMVKARRGE